MEKTQLVGEMLKKGILVSDDIFDSPDYKEIVNTPPDQGLLYVNKDIVGLLKNKISDVNWRELERARVLAEKEDNNVLYEKFLECIKDSSVKKCANEISDIKLVFNYQEPNSKKEVADFVAYFNARYNSIESLLRNRQELSGLTSIARALAKKDRETLAIIGIVTNKTTTAKGNIMLTLEDRTGKIRVIVSSNKKDAFEMAKNLVLDEVIGLVGSTGDKIVFGTNIVLPDVPLNKELKKCPKETYAMFLSDLHVGSTNFLAEKFEKFINWLNTEIGSEEHKQIIKKTKYMFIIGDLVDGIGIYPNQESELEIKDIYEQYQVCAEYLSRVPKHIKIIVCPGNHDSIRMSEPQPAFDPGFAAPLLALPNVMVVSNPAIVNIAGEEGFPGFDILMYHGYSFDYFISNVDKIRNNGGYDRADLVMKFLLQRRHLAPTHSSTLYIPDNQIDPLFINKVPDFFVSGHIHKSYVASYRNVSMICGSCWQSTTSFQVKVGHNPEPAQVPLVNLQTRKTRVLRF